MKNKQKDACYSIYQCAIYVQIITIIVSTWQMFWKHKEAMNLMKTAQDSERQTRKQNKIWWYNMIWYNMIWDDITWYDMIWYDITWYDITWYDITWYEMI